MARVFPSEAGKAESTAPLRCTHSRPTPPFPSMSTGYKPYSLLLLNAVDISNQSETQQLFARAVTQIKAASAPGDENALDVRQ